jgi:hypothetical protein
MLIAFVLLRETNLLDILRHVDRLSNLAATRNLEELSGVARHAVVGLADLGPNFRWFSRYVLRIRSCLRNLTTVFTVT